MSERIDDVLIVGGGDAGLLAGLALDQYNPDLAVTVVDDFDSEIPAIGKSTFLEMRHVLHDRLDIDERRFVEEVKPIWKATAWFRDWADNDPFQYPFDAGAKFPDADRPNGVEAYYYWYDEKCADPEHRSIGEEIVAQGKSPWYYDPRNNNYDRYDRTAYHVDTDRFNAFLREICRERDVSLVNDVIVDVETEGNRVERVASKSQSYEADLYVDASGFARVIASTVERDFRAFDFPLDSAFATQVDNDLSEIIPATVHETGEHGWFWHIDTYDHLDLGYVYASEYVTEDEAREEFAAFCEEYGSADDVFHIEFDSGYYDPQLVENCVVVGNAAGNIEALEATGLTFSAQASVKLARLLANHGRVLDDSLRGAYNGWTKRAWETIYDFIAAHYLYVDPDNEFWEAMAEIPKSRRLELLETEFDEHGFDRTVDPVTKYPDMPGFEIYNHLDFFLIMRHLGVTSEFYEETDVQVSEAFKAEKAEFEEHIQQRVDQFVSTEEFYRSVLESAPPKTTGDD